MKKALVLLVCFLAFCFAMDGAAQATSPIVFPGMEEYYGTGTCGDNLTWVRLPDNPGSAKLIIIGSGPMYDYDYSNRPPWWDCSTVIDEIVIEDGVTSIGYAAFFGKIIYTTKNLRFHLLKRFNSSNIFLRISEIL